MLRPVDDKETREALLAEKSELEAELQQAREAAASTGPGRLPVAVLLSLEEGLGARIAELEERLREEPAVDPLLEQLAVPDPARVVEVWRGWSLTQRRRVLREYTTVARILRTGRTGPRPVPPSQAVEIRWIRAEWGNELAPSRWSSGQRIIGYPGSGAECGWDVIGLDDHVRGPDAVDVDGFGSGWEPALDQE